MTATVKAEQLVNDIENILTKSYDKDYKIEQLAKIVIDEILSNFDTNYDHWFWKGVRKEIVNYNYDYYDISKMETTQTAVQWLALRYHHRQGYLSQEDIEQAKAMEKEQIIESYCKGDDNIGGLQYYNETYNK